MARERDFRDMVRAFWCQGEGREPAIPLGVGTAWIGGAADAARLREMQATLDAAYAGGVRYFDSSARYGASEFRVGAFVARIPRHSIFLATKAGIPPELTSTEAKLHFRQSLHNSLERLQTDRLDLFQVHDVETLEQVFAPGGVLEVLREARDAGLSRYVGIGTRSHDLLRQCAAHPDFDSILTYLDYTLLDQSAAPLIHYAAGEGVGAIQGSPLAFGLLTGPDPRTNPRVGDEWNAQKALAGRLYDWAQAHGVPLLALALQFPLRNPDISLTLTGPATPAETQAALHAARLSIDTSVWDALRAGFSL